MAQSKEELTEEIPVVDKDGARGMVYMFRRFTGFQDVAAGGVTWASAGKRYATSHGEDVNLKADGTFVELLSGRLWRRA